MELHPGWGIQPVPQQYRTLGSWDFVVLWGDLGIGLLVLLAGSFLVPGLSLPEAILAILLGSAIGVALLAMAGIVGSRTGVPTMVLLRPALGIRGSYLPTALNVGQLLGWTVFELIIMGHAANSVSKALVGIDAYWLWLTLSTAIVIGMGVWGPLGVVRRWLGGFAVWIMIATTAWIAWRLLSRHDWWTLWGRPGDGSFPFWAAVDLVIAMPISWMPLVADYSRFARRPGPAAWGTALGYFAANVSFFLLGAVILLAARVAQEPRGFVEAVMLIAGPLALLVLLVDETDEGWADLYSCAVSVQNIFGTASQRGLIVGLGVLCFVLGLVPELTAYESFLLLIGSVFVPLFGVLASDFFAVRGSYDTRELFKEGGAYWGMGGFRPAGLLAWAVGVLAYLGLAGKLQWLGIAGLPWLGASVPAFVVAFVVYWALAALGPSSEPVLD